VYGEKNSPAPTPMPQSLRVHPEGFDSSLIADFSSKHEYFDKTCFGNSGGLTIPPENLESFYPIL